MPCVIAARMGGPCGCFASILTFGHSVRDLWLARNWYRFPRTSPHAGSVAVRPHHVAVVVANNGDGTVTIHDSWAVHRVRIAGLTFVEPRFGSGMADTGLRKMTHQRRPLGEWRYVLRDTRIAYNYPHHRHHRRWALNG